MAAGVWCMWHASSRALFSTGSELSGTEASSREGQTAGVGEVALTEPLRAPEPLPVSEAIAEEMPKAPLPGQRLPPCRKPQVQINGGCWILVGNEASPCSEETYEWKKRCYVPFYGPPRPATSEQKKKPHGLREP